MHKKIKPFYVFVIQYIFFIATVSIFLSLGTVALHELGHSIVASFYKCDNAISYSLGNLPYTEMDCKIDANKRMIIFAGFILTTIFSIIFLLTSKGIFRYASGVIFSMGLLAATLDFSIIGLGKIWIILINIISYLLIAYSVIKMSLSYFKEHQSY